MKISIQQQAGLGDLLFLYKAAYCLAEAGHEVHWSIGYPYWWLKESNQKENIYFYLADDTYSDLEHRNFCDFNINLQYMPVNLVNVLTGKYDEINRVCSSYGLNIDINHHNWQDYLNLLKRDEQKEDFIYKKFCRHYDEYIFVNNKWSSGALDQSLYPQNKNIVWFEWVQGFSILDWVKVFENAKEIYSVDTSVTYALDAFESNANKYKLHLKHGLLDHIATKNIFTRKNWDL
jgi:hypothetical protein